MIDSIDKFGLKFWIMSIKRYLDELFNNRIIIMTKGLSVELIPHFAICDGLSEVSGITQYAHQSPR